MNIQSDARTLTDHWGLPRLWLYRQGAPLRGNPRSPVVGPQPPYRLDLSHQIDVLELVGRLHAERGRTVVVVLHDLNLAARYAQRLVAMKDGASVASGTPEEVLTEQLLADVFDLEARILTDPVAGTPMVVPVRRLR
jgi:iron complex transport system ATP-binding protein